jgi:hypothetical protein
MVTSQIQQSHLETLSEKQTQSKLSEHMAQVECSPNNVYCKNNAKKWFLMYLPL